MTTDLDPTLREILDRHVPVPSRDTADWADVTARAGRVEPVRARRRRRFPTPGRNMLIGIAAAAVLTGFAGAAAHHRIFQLIGIDEPATGPTAQRLVSAFPWPHGLHVRVSQSRVIFKQRQPSDFDELGPTKWSDGLGFVAPLSNGQVCGAEDQGAGADWSCTTPHTPKLLPFSTMAPIGWRDRSGHVHAAAFVFWGVAPSATASVTMEGPGGQRVRVPLSPVRLPGWAVFAVRVPPRVLRPGGSPTALVARNAAGAVIARQSLAAASFTPHIFNRPSPDDSGSTSGGPVVTTGTLLTLHLGADTHRYSLHTEHGICLEDSRSAPTGPQTDIFCGSPYRFASPYIAPVQNRVALIFAMLPRGATTASVVYAHHTNPAVVSHGYYLHIVTTEQLRAADLPLRVVARDHTGAVVALHVFHPADFPGY